MTGFVRPRELAAALAARAAHPDWVVIAGGTDLLVDAPRRPRPAGAIDVWRLPELAGITRAGGVVRIGAGATYREIAEDPIVRALAAPLAAAAREVGALQIQTRATIGGNIGTSSPVGDGLPALLALDATLELASVRGVRHVPYREFPTGYRTTALAADELIVAVRVPEPAPGTHLYWKKVGTRRAQSISKVMGAAAIRIDRGHVVDARVALGAVADRPIRATAVEAAVLGVAFAHAAEAARAAVTAAIQPITDVRSTEAYRREVAANLVARFFTGLDALG